MVGKLRLRVLDKEEIFHSIVIIWMAFTKGKSNYDYRPFIQPLWPPSSLLRNVNMDIDQHSHPPPCEEEVDSTVSTVLGEIDQAGWLRGLRSCWVLLVLSLPLKT